MEELTTDVGNRHACATEYKNYAFSGAFVCTADLVPVHPTNTQVDTTPFAITTGEHKTYTECCDDGLEAACDVKSYAWVYTPPDTNGAGEDCVKTEKIHAPNGDQVSDLDFDVPIGECCLEAQYH